MKLYHTSDRIIQKPEVNHGRRNADFGPGFYLTPDREFTYRWARDNSVVNEYELNLDGLDVHTFKRTVDCFEYIFHNRRADDRMKFDVIIGPIANDTIFDTMGMISSGFLSPEDALKLLMIRPEYTQVAIKTEKAIGKLKWIRAEMISRLDGDIKRLEEEAYQEVFVKAISEIVGDE